MWLSLTIGIWLEIMKIGKQTHKYKYTFSCTLLDSEMRFVLLDLLARLKRRWIKLIVIEHDISPSKPAFAYWSLKLSTFSVENFAYINLNTDIFAFYILNGFISSVMSLSCFNWRVSWLRKAAIAMHRNINREKKNLLDRMCVCLIQVSRSRWRLDR